MFKSLILRAVWLPNLKLPLCGFVVQLTGTGAGGREKGFLFCRVLSEFPHSVWKGGNKIDQEGKFLQFPGPFSIQIMKTVELRYYLLPSRINHSSLKVARIFLPCHSSQKSAWTPCIPSLPNTISYHRLCILTTECGLNPTHPFSFPAGPPFLEILLDLCLGTFNSLLTELFRSCLVPSQSTGNLCGLHCPQDELGLSWVHSSWATAEADCHGSRGQRKRWKVRPEEWAGDFWSW